MSTVRFTATLALSAIMLVTACGQNQSGESANGATPGQPNSPQEPANNVVGRQSSSLWRGGEQAPLDIQVAHPNGVVLQLTSLQSRETETVVGVRVINGHDHEIHLNRFNNRDGYIVVESGERLYLSPPPGNTRLSVQPGQTLEGELVFLGRLPPTQSAILVLNEHNTSDSQFARSPGFRVNLPLSNPTTAGPAS